MKPYSIGSDAWPGLSKLIEECGETIQVAGKLMGTGGAVEHWDGSNLGDRLIEEIGDLQAAIEFFVETNDLDIFRINRIASDLSAICPSTAAIRSQTRSGNTWGSLIWPYAMLCWTPSTSTVSSVASGHARPSSRLGSK